MLYRDRLKLRLREDWWRGQFVVPWFGRCHVKVLMVADGATFGPGGGYTVSRVLEAIQHDLPPWLAIDVTTARHHSTSPDASADVNDLHFDTHDLDGYDQVWLFAVSGGESLDDAEVSALWDFMQGGGGVFATGDHEALGLGLCGRLPRVRSMRRWYHPAPGPNGEPVAPARNISVTRGENDSTTTAGGDDFDGVPQTIAPVMRPVPGILGVLGVSAPHPLLCGKDGIVDVLPDHMHEGQIEEVDDIDLERPITVGGVGVEEYPRRGADRWPPQMVARSTVNNNPAKGAFGVIGAYDGHLVDEIAGGVGRVVVDSTWHHFWNLNTEQFAGAHDAVKAAVDAGVAPDPADVAPAMAWESIRDYFQNIAVWLARRQTQSCIRRRGLWVIAHHVDVLMALQTPAADRVVHLVDLGTKARDALQQLAPQCERVRWLVDLAPPLLVDRFPELHPPRPDGPPIPMIDPQHLEDLLLGALVEGVAEAGRGVRSEKELARFASNDALDKRLRTSLGKATTVLASRMQADAKMLRSGKLG